MWLKVNTALSLTLSPSHSTRAVSSEDLLLHSLCLCEQEEGDNGSCQTEDSVEQTREGVGKLGQKGMKGSIWKGGRGEREREGGDYIKGATKKVNN